MNNEVTYDILHVTEAADELERLLMLENAIAEDGVNTSADIAARMLGFESASEPGMFKRAYEAVKQFIMNILKALGRLVGIGKDTSEKTSDTARTVAESVKKAEKKDGKMDKSVRDIPTVDKAKGATRNPQHSVGDKIKAPKDVDPSMTTSGKKVDPRKPKVLHEILPFRNQASDATAKLVEMAKSLETITDFDLENDRIQLPSNAILDAVNKHLGSFQNNPRTSEDKVSVSLPYCDVDFTTRVAGAKGNHPFVAIASHSVLLDIKIPDATPVEMGAGALQLRELAEIDKHQKTLMELIDRITQRTEKMRDLNETIKKAGNINDEAVRITFNLSRTLTIASTISHLLDLSNTLKETFVTRRFVNVEV